MAAQNGLKENEVETQESLGDEDGGFVNDDWACRIQVRTQVIQDGDGGYEETLSGNRLYTVSRCVQRIREQEDDVNVCDCPLRCWSRQSVECRIGFGDEGQAEADDGFCWSENHCFFGFWRRYVAWS